MANRFIFWENYFYRTITLPPVLLLHNVAFPSGTIIYAQTQIESAVMPKMHWSIYLSVYLRTWLGINFNWVYFHLSFFLLLISKVIALIHALFVFWLQQQASNWTWPSLSYKECHTWLPQLIFLSHNSNMFHLYYLYPFLPYV